MMLMMSLIRFEYFKNFVAMKQHVLEVYKGCHETAYIGSV